MRIALNATFVLFCSTLHAADKPKSIGRIVRNDAKINKLIPADAKIEVLADGFDWSEGPVWVPREGGYVLFSDIPRNSIFKWKEGEGISLFMKPAGYTGTEPWGPEPGTNGLVLDAKGRLVMCEHGNRRITRLDREKDCIKTVLVSHYQGKKLNSPNDAVFNRRGDLYFTDPPYGLPKRAADPRREQPHFGVYRLAADGTLTLVTAKMTRPNGIALSPDEKRLYVAQSDGKQPIWRVFDLGDDGLPKDDAGRIFYDAAKWYGKAPGGCDGMCVDRAGNLFATGPGGVHVFTPDGTHLGLIETNQRTANCTFGGPNGSVLYITADMYLCRVKTSTKGLSTARSAPSLSKGRGKPMRIVATTTMVADLVGQVVGDRCEVTEIIGHSVDPHVYRPTRENVQQLRAADMVFYSGLMLEGRMAGILKELKQNDKAVHAVTANLEKKALLFVPDGEHPNPYVWGNVSLWSRCAGLVAEKMADHDPDNADLYKKNAKAYQAKLDKLDTYVKQVIESVPKKQRLLISPYDGFGYFAKRYAIEVETIDTAVEVSIADVNRLVDQVVRRKIKAVFTGDPTFAKGLDAVVQGSAVQGWKVQTVAAPLFSDTMGKPGTYRSTYVGMMDHNATIIARSLGGKAPEKGFQGKLDQKK